MSRDLQAAHQWRGVIEEYRPYLDLLPDDLEPVTLREGGTPLVHSGWLSERAEGDVWLKVAG
jgi:threonine synthase